MKTKKILKKKLNAILVINADTMKVESAKIITHLKLIKYKKQIALLKINRNENLVKITAMILKKCVMIIFLMFAQISNVKRNIAL